MEWDKISVHHDNIWQTLFYVHYIDHEAYQYDVICV